MASTPLRLLSLDGGGVKGYSEIIMLEAIMKRVQKLLNLERVPLPAEYFDLIGGTSTGGLIAIMLGRLRMSIEETVQAYEMLSERIFSKKSVLSKIYKKSRFDTELFTSIVQAVIREKVGDSHAKLIDNRADTCKISYDAEYNLEHNCEIWEAARATSAAPTYFAPIEIGPPGRNNTFVDGGLGCNNPIYQLHLEAERLFKGSRKVACIVSLGTGQKKTNEIAQPTFMDNFVPPFKLMNSIKRLAIDCERKAEDMDLKYRGMKDVYFRLNVEHGLESTKLANWERLAAVRVHTMAYLEQPTVAERLDSIAALLAGIDTQRRTYQLSLLSFSNDVVIAAATGLSPDEVAGNTEQRGAFYHAWFSSQNPGVSPARDQRDNLAKRFVDETSKYTTCSWVFDTTEFREFKSSHKPLTLWIKGSPGCGKSVLTSAVIDHLTAIDKSNHVLHYYCHQDPVQTTFRDILCSLLAQTTQWEDEEIPQLMQDFRMSSPTLVEENREVDLKLLQLLLLIISTRAPHKVYIIIDSIESCEGRRRPIPFLMHLICRAKGGPRPSLLFTSRWDSESICRNHSIAPLREGKHQLKLLQLEITPDLTTPDLKAMVSYRVDDPDGPLGSRAQEQRDFITNTISDRAHGMFLYATLVLDELRGDKVASRSAVKSTLDSLPKGIYLTYQRQFESLKDKRKAPEIFWWVFAAIRELTWDELRAGIAVVDGAYDEDERIEQPAEEFIRETCGPLVELCGENKSKLRFIHPTVKEALNQRDGPGRMIHIQSAHSTIAHKLLAMLMSADVPDFGRQAEDPSRVIADYINIPGRELYKYAVLNWYLHLKACEHVPDKLQRTLVAFLSSNNCLKWLVTALVMRQCTQTALVDLFTLARDVSDCLWSWMRTHKAVIQADVRTTVSTWSEHFLNLMLDWRSALHNQPRYIYSLHFDLVPNQSLFHRFVGTQTYQSVTRFSDDTIRTRSSMEPLWTNHVFAVDETRDWVYAYQNGYLQCYHTETGLIVAEAYLGHMGLQEAIMSPDKGFIALSFATLRVTDKEVAKYISNIQQGFHLTAYFSKGFLTTWCLESVDFDLTKVIFEFFVGSWVKLDHVVCLVQLNYQGLSRTNLFGLLSGMSSFNLKTWKAPAALWKVDGPSMLAFSPDSKYLSTPCGRTQMVDGAPTESWPVTQHASETALRSTVLSSNFGTLATIKERRSIEIWNVEPGTPGSLRSSISIDGVGHILAISSHARFVLLLRIQSCGNNENFSPEILFKPREQQGTITIYDSQEETWTDLTVLKPPLASKQGPWAFQDSPCRAAFASESTDIDKLMVYVPAGWAVADNVRFGNQVLEPNALVKRGHLLIFHSSHQASGFAPHPTLQHMIPLEPLNRPIKMDVLAGQPDLNRKDVGSTFDNFHNPAVVSWEENLESVFVYFKGRMSRMTAQELQAMAISEQRRRSTLKQHDNEESEEILKAGTFVPASRDVTYRFQLIREVKKGGAAESVLQADAKSAKTRYRHHLRVERVGINDIRPSSCSILDVFPPNVEHIPLNSLHATISDTGRLRLGDREFQLSLTDGSLKASAQDTYVLRAAVEAFSMASRPFHPSRGQALMSLFLASSANFHYAIFESTPPAFEDIPSGARASVKTDYPHPTLFVPIVTKLCQEHLYLCQFSRAFDSAEVVCGAQRETRSFEVFLCIYDTQKRELTWMTHTTTGGNIDGSEFSAPKVAWALHPTKPLLAWSLPGQKPKISHIKSCFQPINIAEPITFQAEPSESLSFSPNGRYLLARGADALCNVLMQDRSDVDKAKISVFDLVTGFRTTLLLTSSTKLSVDIDDSCVRIYRVTRDDAVEMNVFQLPDLVKMERFNLSYIPADCCCVTCGIAFQRDCDVFVQHRNDSVNVILSHGTVHVGQGPLQSQACEPIILRAGKPNLSLDIAANDALIPERNIGLCPIILNAIGEFDLGILKDCAQSDPDQLQIGGQEPKEEFPPHRDDEESVKARALRQLSWGLFQIADMNEFKSSNEELTTQLGTLLQVARREAVKQPVLQILSFKDLKHNKRLELEQVESAVKELEDYATSTLVLTTTGRDWGQRAWDSFRATKAGQALPFDSWAEVKELALEMEEDQDFHSHFQRLWPPGQSGLGTKIPILIHTFLLGRDSVSADGRASPHLQWSCAVDIGWIEENIDWWYERLFLDRFEDLRAWYNFPAMYKAGARFSKLVNADTPEGERLRKSLSPFFSKTAPSIEHKDEAVIDYDGEASTAKKDQGDDRLDVFGSLELDEYMENMEEAFSALSPGLGEFMKTRMKWMVRKCFEHDIEDGEF